PCHLLERDAVRQRVDAGSSQLLRCRESQQVERRELRNRLRGKALLDVEMRREGLELPLRELAHHVADHLLLVGQENHASPRRFTSRATPISPPWGANPGCRAARPSRAPLPRGSSRARAPRARALSA